MEILVVRTLQDPEKFRIGGTLIKSARLAECYPFILAAGNQQQWCFNCPNAINGRKICGIDS